MIDFTEMEYGVIKSKKGIVLVVNGRFLGPFSKRRYDEVIQILENQNDEQDGQ